MKLPNTSIIGDGVFYVGVRDWNRRLFDALIPLPQGTTYNSYLIKGNEKIALIDTVNPGFEAELENKINNVSATNQIDFIIMNHAEPDHAGAITYILHANNKAKLVTTRLGAQAAKTYFQVPEERIIVIKDNDILELGGKTLKFIEAPMLHWPETMFTYLVQDKILFTCDFFGMHTAYGFYDEDIDELKSFAQRYFGEIMMPFRSLGLRAMQKIKDLDIKMIAPSHGPIHKNPQRILEHYSKWVNGETQEKVIVVYVTMWKSTEKMVNQLVDGLLQNGIHVSVHNLSNADLGEVAKDLVDARAIVFGTPTVLGKMHPLAVYAAHLVKVLKPPLRLGVVLTSYGWGKGALAHAVEVLGPTGLEVVGSMEVNGPPTEKDFDKVKLICEELTKRIKELQERTGGE
jgi:flavorubredoxin